MPAISPQFSHQAHEREPISLDFRAPPPSPIPGSRRASSVTNDDVLTEFLEHTLRVPDLILPGRILPKQRPLQDVLTVDFRALTGSVAKIRESLASIGCFQVVNHGISPELIGSVAHKAARIFGLSAEQKRRAARAAEMPLGFDEVGGEREEEVMCEMSEEFFWGRSYGFNMKMEGIWPVGYSKFSEKMEALASAIEKVGKELMLVIQEKAPNSTTANDNEGGKIIRCSEVQQMKGCICHMYKHPHGVPIDQCISSLRYDVIRMMIKGSEYSHAVTLHICDGSSEFHVYSKKGWLSFTPLENALVVTAGDLLQAWSDGQYKNVIGRPIYTSKTEDCLSMAFLYSPPPIIDRTLHQEGNKKERIISLREQVLFAIFFTIACQFLLHIYSKIL